MNSVASSLGAALRRHATTRLDGPRRCRGAESFESALVFGTPAGIEVITTEIYHLIHHVNRPDYPQATALAPGTMVMTFGLVLRPWHTLQVGTRQR